LDPPFISRRDGSGQQLVRSFRIKSCQHFRKKVQTGSHRVPGGASIVPITTGLGSTGNIYAELGVTPLVNINGTVTVIGGSVMRPEVMELMRRRERALCPDRRTRDRRWKVHREPL
jgi:hypothetical protein